MTRSKCSSCGKDAFAYLIEPDGSRVYLCVDHFPDADAQRADDTRNPVNKKSKNAPGQFSMDSLIRQLRRRIPQLPRHIVR
jgi:hypothetical protein